MTRVTCCGGIDRDDPIDGASETHPDRAPSKTRNCYKNFDYDDCNSCCDAGGDCYKSRFGGYCLNEEGEYIYRNGEKYKLTAEDVREHMRDLGRDHDHYDRRRSRREMRTVERNILNKIAENEILSSQNWRRNTIRGRGRAQLLRSTAPDGEAGTITKDIYQDRDMFKNTMIGFAIVCVILCSLIYLEHKFKILDRTFKSMKSDKST